MGRDAQDRRGRNRGPRPGWAWIVLGIGLLVGANAWAQRPPTNNHVPELAAYLDRVQIAEPVVHRQLAVYPILLTDRRSLSGRWLTLDRAIARGVLAITEKGAGGSVPVVVVENRSRDERVFLMTGEVIAGGKQTRTLRHDVVLSPGQRVELSVFCVEAHRWQGSAAFSSGKVLLPQSIQMHVRKGADQAKVWSEVARNNAQLSAENKSGSLELALNEPSVKGKLSNVRQAIAPRMPQGTLGFVFVARGRALGAELFGSEELARDLLPKLLDSYAVDYLLIPGEERAAGSRAGHRVAIEFFERLCRAGSRRSDTPGSGAGISTRTDRLLGDGVSINNALIHYGVQAEDRTDPPKVGPQIIYPQTR